MSRRADPSEERELALLERIASLLRSERRAAAQNLGLQPVQFEILEYLGDCNRYSNTPLAITEYLRQTKGTVSQSILRLEEKGFVQRTADPGDGRVWHLSLTARGRRALDRDWRQAFRDARRAVVALNPAGLAESLEALLRTLQRERKLRTFGQCSTCRFFQREGTRKFRCGLTSEELSRSDSELICREHEPT